MSGDAAPNPRPATAPSGDDLLIREAQDRFIAAWGQMAGAWGISRTMAEVHALLYITGESLNTDEVMDRLQISRGNASMSLRSLLDWGIVERAHRRGDRKEYFRAEQDVWALFRAIVRERLKREVDPLLASLYEIRDLTAPADRKIARKPDDRVAQHNKRLDDMLGFLRTAENLGAGFVGAQGKGLKLAAMVLGSQTPSRKADPGRPTGQEGAEP